MRTTVDIDDTALAAARSLARTRGLSLGAAISELIRRGLADRPEVSVDHSYSPFPVIVGDEGVVVTDQLISELRDA